MRISIIVPCFNCAKTIEEAYESIAAQSFRDFEVVLIDDASTDETRAILQRIAARDNRVQIITFDKNLGVSAARNSGINSAKGEFLFFMDGDDVIKPNCLQTLERAALPDVDFVRAKHFWWLSERNQTRTNPDEEVNFVEAIGISPNSYPQIVNVFSCWNALFRRSLIIQNNISFPEAMRLGEDRYFNIQYFAVARKITLLNDYTYLWRKGAANNGQATQILVADPVHVMQNALDFLSLKNIQWLEENARHRAYLSTTVLVEMVSRLTNFSRLLETSTFPKPAKEALGKIFAELKPEDVVLSLPSIKGRSEAFNKLYQLGADFLSKPSTDEFFREFIIELGKIRKALSPQSRVAGATETSAAGIVFAAFRSAISRRSSSEMALEAELIRRSNLLDVAFYRTNNPDVAEAKMDEVKHYQLFGVPELRNPNEWFNTSEYLKEHPDLMVSGLNPLFHYSNHSSVMLSAVG